MPKVGMTKSNTPVFEQAFIWMNKFRNLKTMKEGHFKLLLLYVIDLHNLHIEKKVDLLANPLNQQREAEIQKLNDELALQGLSNLSLHPKESLQSEQASATPTEKDEDRSESAGFTELPNGEFIRKCISLKKKFLASFFISSFIKIFPLLLFFLQ